MKDKIKRSVETKRKKRIESGFIYSKEHLEILSMPESEARHYLLQRIYHKNRRDKILKLLGDICKRCGFSDKRALQIDHINGDGKIERKSMHNHAFWRKVLLSIENKEDIYQLLCANCNWIKRAENNESKVRKY